MAQTDLSLPELRAYAPDIVAPEDFDTFWADTLAEARALATPASFTPAEQPLRTLESFDVTFAGWGGHPVKAWLHLPRARTGTPLPCVVEFMGYGGGRGLVHERTLWASAGYAHLVMDSRGQGSGWLTGDTPDPVGSAPSTGNFITQGLTDPASYYYRRLYTDAVRAVETAREHPAVDAARVLAAGGSQGGALTLAVAGLVGDEIAGALPDVPFLCHFERAIAITDAYPYRAITDYLKVRRRETGAVLRTLSYVDGVHFARRAVAPALFSIALMDETCPPSTCFAAYNAYGGAKDVRVYPYNDHEGGQGYHDAERLAWVADLVG